MALTLDCGFVILRLSHVKDLECQIVGDSPDQGFVERVVLHVINNRGMVSVYTRSLDLVIMRLEGFKIPKIVSPESH